MVDSREVRRRALQDADLKKLRRKLLFRFLLLFPLTYLIGVAAMALVIDGALQDPFARFFLALAQALGGLSEDQSLVLYHNIFRDHKGFWTALLLVCIFFSLFFLLLRQFTRYLRLVDDKLDELLVEQVPFPVELPPELEFLDEKMNRIKEALKERQLAAQESEQRKNDLVVNLAHDIKTPLTSVIGYLSLLEEAPDMPAAQRAKYTHITLEKSYRLEDLINQFFDITRFNLQHIVLEKEPVRLDVMLAQLADEFYPMLAAQGKWAQLQVEPGLTVEADPDKLARVFNNILKNAVAYSDPNTALEIEGSRQGDQVVLAFHNKGKPIPPHQLETIFEKFYRLDSARSSQAGGAGLGLAIARQIVTLHGGTITARSDAARTTFTVTLPAPPGSPNGQKQ